MQALQGAVGGLVDVVALDDGIDMWVNDEGLFVCEPNPVGWGIARGYGTPQVAYFGAVVFTGGPDDTGRTRGLDEATVEVLGHRPRATARPPARRRHAAVPPLGTSW